VRGAQSRTEVNGMRRGVASWRTLMLARIELEESGAECSSGGAPRA